MIKVNQVVIVEGKYDKIKLSSIIDGVIIETEGFGVFKNKEKQRMIRKLAEKRGIVILTDSDSAGFLIRSFISSIVPNEFITNIYIPDVYGKEKRKDSPSKEGKLGVEGVSANLILKAFEQAGIGCETIEASEIRTVTALDFYEDGLSGVGNSKNKRKLLLKYLDLPERMSTKGMLEIINLFMTYGEYKDAVKKCTEAEK